MTVRPSRRAGGVGAAGLGAATALTACGGGSDAAYLRSYADRGALLDLEDLEGLDTSGIDAETLAVGESEGGLFGLVQGVVPLAVVTGTTILQVDAIADVVDPASIPPVDGSSSSGISTRTGSDVLFDRTTPAEGAKAHVEELQASLDSA